MRCYHRRSTLYQAVYPQRGVCCLEDLLVSLKGHDEGDRLLPISPKSDSVCSSLERESAPSCDLLGLSQWTDPARQAAINVDCTRPRIIASSKFGTYHKQ